MLHRNKVQVSDEEESEEEEGDEEESSSEETEDEGKAPKPELDPTQDGKLFEGRRINIYWEGDRKWYAGRVHKYTRLSRNDRHQFRIWYDDGDRQNEYLAEDGLRWHLLPEDEPKLGKRGRESDGMFLLDEKSANRRRRSWLEF